MSTAYLMLAHRPPYHLATLAAQQPQARFYLHYDVKSPFADLYFLRGLHNVKILNNRINIHWGGFSMIEATLVLMQAALADSRNQYFHLISGDCLPLQSPEHMTNIMQQTGAGCLFLTCHVELRLRYRVRFNVPHADSNWQRSLLGKLLTKVAQIADSILPSQIVPYSGSQWFSADRVALQLLFNESLGDRVSQFERKLCPDEHFFQHIAQKHQSSLHWVNQNHRYIQFAGHANHPDFLTLAQVQAACRQDFWFARKVRPEIAVAFWADKIAC
ncbi:beta-1,6-N-acetylglucosaminyltransferase [Kingella kingae]|uniref:beta-1,6-N-acetylglucosaminyltransferase n=1 Tax=Kingella kingae TaxID=504 RepID=UPI0004261C8F|nr:beta-1,6-N-acetylglucosaminyltransferase [Kingella kingae]